MTLPGSLPEFDPEDNAENPAVPDESPINDVPFDDLIPPDDEATIPNEPPIVEPPANNNPSSIEAAATIPITPRPPTQSQPDYVVTPDRRMPLLYLAILGAAAAAITFICLLVFLLTPRNNPVAAAPTPPTLLVTSTTTITVTPSLDVNATLISLNATQTSIFFPTPTALVIQPGTLPPLIPANTLAPPAAVTMVLPTPIPPTFIPPTFIPPTMIPPTPVPPTPIPPTWIPPTSLPATSLPPTAVPPVVVPGVTRPTANTLVFRSEPNQWVAFVNVSDTALLLDQFQLLQKNHMIDALAWVHPVLQPGECLRIVADQEPDASPKGCTTVIDLPEGKKDRTRWVREKTTVVINPSTTFCYPVNKCD